MFILMLRKGVYLLLYIDYWEKINDKSLEEKKNFYSPLNIEENSDADYKHDKRVCKDFK